MNPQLYVFAGAPKCGSTWFYDQFRRHPEATVGRIKDPYYFDRHHARGDDWYWSLFGARTARTLPVGTYADLSHDYMYDPMFPARATATATARGADLFVHVVLRNPAERLRSAVRYQISFEGVARPGGVREAYPKMVAESMYSEHIDRLLAEIPAERLRIDLFEDLETDPYRLMSEVCSWLSIVPNGEWLDTSPSRPRRGPRRPALALRARRAGVLLRRARLEPALERLKTSGVAERILFRHDDPADPAGGVDLAPVSELLSDDIARLSSLLGRDLLATWGSTG